MYLYCQGLHDLRGHAAQSCLHCDLPIPRAWDKVQLWVLSSVCGRSGQLLHRPLWVLSFLTDKGSAVLSRASACMIGGRLHMGDALFLAAPFSTDVLWLPARQSDRFHSSLALVAWVCSVALLLRQLVCMWDRTG